MQAARQGEGNRALAGLARAPTTPTAKTARLRTWDRLAAEAGFVGRLTPAALEAVGGALIAGGYSLANLYAGDALQRHRRDGGIVAGQLEEITKDIKRPLSPALEDEDGFFMNFKRPTLAGDVRVGGQRRHGSRFQPVQRGRHQAVWAPRVEAHGGGLVAQFDPAG